MRGELDQQEFLKFLKEAKLRGYASSVETYSKTKHGGKFVEYSRGDYKFTDEYFGNLIDCGQERVLFQGKVIWCMAYRGGIIEKYANLHNEAFIFLKKCISQRPMNFPARGPKEFTEGDWIYGNIWQGDINGFLGEENIYYRGEKICFRNYLGGKIKNKE